MKCCINRASCDDSVGVVGKEKAASGVIGVIRPVDESLGESKTRKLCVDKASLRSDTRLPRIGACTDEYLLSDAKSKTGEVPVVDIVEVVSVIGSVVISMGALRERSASHSAAASTSVSKRAGA
jgi:hypothetical protein